METRLRALIVEDYPDAGKVLALQVIRNYEAIIREDGLQAHEYLQAHPGEINLLLASWESAHDRKKTLPEGVIEIAHEQRIPIILMTTNPDEEHTQYLSNKYIVSVLVKPFTLEELLDEIHRAIVLQAQINRLSTLTQ